MRLEFISMYLIVIFSVLFVYNLFHVEFSKRLFCFFHQQYCLYCSCAVRNSAGYFVLLHTAILSVNAVLQFLWHLYFCKALRNKKVEAVFYLASFIIAAAQRTERYPLACKPYH